MTRINMPQTGRHIRALMAERGLNPTKVAKLMGLEVQTPYKWIWGKNLPKVEHLVMLSDILEVPMEEVLVIERR